MFEADQWIFKKFWDIQKKYKEKKIKKTESPHVIYLKEIDIRLSRLAYAIGQKNFRIKQAEGEGRIVHQTFFLPAKMDLADTREGNVRAYILRLTFSCAMWDLGIVLDHDLKKSVARIDLSLLCIPTLEKNIFHEFPPLKDEYVKLMKILFNKDGNVESVKTENDFYKLWIHTILGHQYELASLKTIQDFFQKNIFKKIETKSVLLDLANKVDEYRKALNLEQGKFLFSYPLIWTYMPLESNVIGVKNTVATKALKEQNADSKGTEMQAPSKESVKKVKMNENDEDAMPVTHILEKVTTADIYDGGVRTIDGSDELKDHYEALSELNLREVVRTHRKTQSIYRADISLMTDFSDESEDIVDGDFQYDEWDYNKKSYLKDWCALVQGDVQKNSQDHNSKIDFNSKGREIRELRSLIMNVLSLRKQKKKQFDGQDVDIDAVIDRYAELKAGISKTDKLYIKNKLDEKDVAILLLIDASLSTDSWVEGRRVMDISKEMTFILSQVLDGIFDRVGIFAFYSNTRRDCHYLKLKDFTEEWKAPIERIQYLEPTGYTRIGPAIRHSIRLLNQTHAKKKIIIFVSDGKPTDYDAYEGVYGIEDVRQAVREATQSQIHMQSLAIDKQAKVYFPQMFGAGNYQVLNNSKHLPQALVKIFMKLVH